MTFPNGNLGKSKQNNQNVRFFRGLKDRNCRFHQESLQNLVIFFFCSLKYFFCPRTFKKLLPMSVTSNLAVLCKIDQQGLIIRSAPVGPKRIRKKPDFYLSFSRTSISRVASFSSAWAASRAYCSCMTSI